MPDFLQCPTESGRALHPWRSRSQRVVDWRSAWRPLEIRLQERSADTAVRAPSNSQVTNLTHDNLVELLARAGCVGVGRRGVIGCPWTGDLAGLQESALRPGDDHVWPNVLDVESNQGRAAGVVERED